MQSSTTPETTTDDAQKQQTIREFLFKEFNEKHSAVVNAVAQSTLSKPVKELIFHYYYIAGVLTKESFATMAFNPQPNVATEPDATPETPSNVVELPRKKRKYTMKKKNGKRKST